MWCIMLVTITIWRWG